VTTEDFEREFLAIRARYREGCTARIREVRDLLAPVQADRDPAAGVKLVRALHRFAGSAGSFGFARLSELARAAEEAARAATGTLGPRDLGPLRHALTALELEVAREQQRGRFEDGASAEPAAPEPAPVRRVDPRPAIRFCSAELEARFGMALREAGYRTELCAETSATPFAVVARQDELTSCGQARVGHRIALLGSESFADRLAAARSGARSVLIEPVEDEDLVEALEEIRGGDGARPPRLVIVDDDEEQAREVARILGLEGMSVRWTTRASDALDVVREHRPDVLLTDLHMPNCNGFDLAAIVRQDPSLNSLPVVFMSADGDELLQRQAMRHDGDAFVLKSEALHVMTELIWRKTRRARQLEASMTTDGMTGLLRHAVFKERLATEVTRCRRQDLQMSCVMIDIDHFKSINDRFGHATGDRVIQGLGRLLRRRFRATDLMARYGGEEFALALLDVDPERAIRLVDDLRVRFERSSFPSPSGPVQATLSAGVSAFPEHGDRDALLHGADDALYAAKRAGRNRVMVHGSLSGHVASA
jgi:diguanylate cyclase (GGDEF)-like protein